MEVEDSKSAEMIAHGTIIVNGKIELVIVELSTLLSLTLGMVKQSVKCSYPISRLSTLHYIMIQSASVCPTHAMTLHRAKYIDKLFLSVCMIPSHVQKYVLRVAIEMHNSIREGIVSTERRFLAKLSLAISWILDRLCISIVCTWLLLQSE